MVALAGVEGVGEGVEGAADGLGVLGREVAVDDAVGHVVVAGDVAGLRDGTQGVADIEVFLLTEQGGELGSGDGFGGVVCFCFAGKHGHESGELSLGAAGGLEEGEAFAVADAGAVGVVDGGQRGTDRGQCRVGAESGRWFHVFTVEIGTDRNRSYVRLVR
ncbi:hypothetical protein KDB89_08400 [Tessaracoccus palaemonis]|uniref:Uncharacterized protein n=1 Tax=Tessaracoccus palaemonis TaxID=2829499 RepID=A0ABX8SNC0_9ACTN|nr:hypothetical protein [Tessaracoccus palaemonis]QXT64429.1 hypothetical protein KDB89_08400 [Tessaracoccus palaemonis]